MGKWLEIEKQHQTDFKRQSASFSTAARQDGHYKGKPRPFCLSLDCAGENLHTSIRTAAPAYFAENRIGWHDGKAGQPSNHLCDSQVCCVNFLFPFMDKPAALADLMRPVFPELRQMLPLEADNQFVAFEWIGQENYLGKKIRGKGQRTRGANFTSADAMVMFERNDNQRQIALIEWKYTESYSSTSKHFSKHGTDRSLIYRPLFEREDCPLDKALLPDFSDLFYEPFYQFMRQQFLAHEMERARELEADRVSLLHIAPAHNVDFQKVTSPALRPLGNTVIAVWKRLVKESDRFASVSSESLFGDFATDSYPELAAWQKYIHERYIWLAER
jgi:hypothetical protein